MKSINNDDEVAKITSFFAPPHIECKSYRHYLGRRIQVGLTRLRWSCRDLFTKFKFKWRDNAYVERKIARSEFGNLELKVKLLTGLWVNNNQDNVRMNEIIPGLFLGSQTAVNCKTDPHLLRLKKCGITHILSIANVGSPRNRQVFPKDIVYKLIELNLTEEKALQPHLKSSYDYIDQARQRGGVLVHCQLGQSRSPAFVIAYLMKKYMLPFTQAFQIVKDRRSCIESDSKFMQELNETRLA